MKLTAKSPTPNKYPRMLTQIMAAMENTSIVFWYFQDTMISVKRVLRWGKRDKKCINKVGYLLFRRMAP